MAGPESGKQAPGLASFVPDLLARRFADGEGPRHATSESLSAAALFADISGFTALTERLTEAGPAGLEELTRVLNAHFGRLIETISNHGGDILKFAGDSLLAIWPSRDDGLASATGTAARCGLAAQAVFREASAPESLRLSLRIAIGAGPISLLIVGGVNGRWEMVARGEALRQLGAISHLPSPGQVAIAAPALAVIASSLRAKTVEDGAGIIEAVSTPEVASRKASVPFATSRETALRGFVPVTVASHLESGSAEWLGESRRVSVVFTHFPGLNDAPLDRAQEVMALLQSVVDRYEGSINKISVDDKGAAMLAAFGLPPLAHEDDAWRALQAALEIRRKFREAKVRHSTGVTTGRVFCGMIGNATRREYTIIGDVVNLSARLMQAAGGDILCDEATRRAAHGSVAVDALTPIVVKGKASPVLVFRPLATRAAGATRTKTALIGREAEKALIGERLCSLASKGEGSVIVIQGDAGIGKSRLLEDLTETASALAIPLLHGSARHVDRFTPYYLWRDVFSRLCGLEGVDDPEIRRRRAAGCFGGDPDCSSLLPLANPVLSTDFRDTEATASLAAPAKYASANELFAKMLSLLPARGAPKVVLLEDCHWADSSSLALAVEAARKIPRLLLVVTARPFAGAIPEEFTAIANAPGTLVLRLQPLSPVDAVHLAALRLGVARLPEPVADLIREKAEGNPLFSEELAYALRDLGVITIADGECRISPSAGDLRNIDVPDSVQAAMTSRIDRLPNPEQVLLKAASVIGRVFHLTLLGEVYPISPELEHLSDMLKAVEERGMVFREVKQGDAWTFHHVTLQRVAYSLMLHSQRLHLHRAVAQRLETTQAAERGSQIALIAYHWSKIVEYGEQTPDLLVKVAGHLKEAADQALRSASNREAVAFLDEALRFAGMLPDGEVRDRLELSLQVAIGKPLLETAGYTAPETRRAYTRAWDLCQRLGAVPEKFEVLLGLWNVHMVGASVDQALDLISELQAIAQGAGDPIQGIIARSALGTTLYWAARPTEVMRHMAMVLARYRPEYNCIPELRRGPNPAVVACGMLAWSRWMTGVPDQAAEALEQGFRMADELAHPFSSALLRMHAAMTHQFRGDAAKTLKLAEALLADAEEHGFGQWRAGALVMRGWALCELGRTEEGTAELERGLAGWQATGATLVGPYYLSLKAVTRLKAGDLEVAADTVDYALACAQQRGELWWEADLLRVKGDVLRASGRDGGEPYWQALQLARRQGARSLELRASMGLAQWMMDNGRRDVGHGLLSGIFHQFSEGFETGDLREARSLLEQLEQSGGRSGIPG